MKLSDLDKELESKSLAGFWNVRVPMHRPEAPHLWKWEGVKDGLMKALDSISLEMAERRVIRLVSPHVPGSSASHTLQFTFSIVNAGEVARAHRHNMAAIRFVVQGKGAFTTVEGERFPMEEGDLILTPNWTWHDHFNGSKEPVIWLDGLDGPLIQSLNVLFFEQLDKEAQAVTEKEGGSLRRLGFARSPKISAAARSAAPFRYGWKETYEALNNISEAESDAYDGNLIRYINPMTGSFTLPTISCEMQLLKAGKITKAHRHTSTSLYHVFRGRGRTVIGEGGLEWEKGDSFTVPLWQRHYHENLSGDEAVLFSINDRPIMEKLDLYREES